MIRFIRRIAIKILGINPSDVSWNLNLDECKFPSTQDPPYTVTILKDRIVIEGMEQKIVISAELKI